MIYIFAFIVNGTELVQRIMIFDKFAIFVQQMKEIVSDTLPLASMLAFIILSQTVIFWLLDRNSQDPKYDSVSGFASCFVDSYMLALGDFQTITTNFQDNSGNMILFWVIFFVGTILTLLIILNMVIALMSATFERVQGETESHILRAKL